MKESRFWEIIQQAHDKAGPNMDEKCDAIKTALSNLPADEAIEFYRLFDSMMDRAYSWPLWAAAYIVNGGCSDDGFMDFRSSLISRGPTAFERVLSDPESLAEEEFDEDSWFYEGYQYAVTNGVKMAAGLIPAPTMQPPTEPSGQAWKENEVYLLFPKLSAKFA